ncbi:hypothetical protein KM043_007403 [Ampulex compressa]|nr:hypothetical protein KM043_007403 [Ampulex compressa]
MMKLVISRFSTSRKSHLAARYCPLETVEAGAERKAGRGGSGARNFACKTSKITSVARWARRSQVGGQLVSEDCTRRFICTGRKIRQDGVEQTGTWKRIIRDVTSPVARLNKSSCSAFLG